jgi:hypothetical protein
MDCRVITFNVTIDGAKDLHVGTIGAMGNYNSDLIKGTIDKQYRIDNPDAKSIAVSILNVEIVPQEKYNEASKNFIRLTR